MGALNGRMLFLNQDPPPFKPPASGQQCPSTSSLPPWAVRASRLLDTAAREAQHHPGLATQPWGTEQALSACTQGGVGGKGKAGLTLGAPFSHGSREGSGQALEISEQTDPTSGYSQTLPRDTPTHTEPLQPNQQRNECRNLSKTGPGRRHLLQTPGLCATGC